MQRSPTARQTCVHDTLNCFALAVIASLVIALALHLRPTIVMGYVGYVLLATALAQGVLSWLAQLGGDLDATLGIVLGGVSTLTTAGLLLIASAIA